jgi:hypothetical protein
LQRKNNLTNINAEYGQIYAVLNKIFLITLSAVIIFFTVFLFLYPQYRAGMDGLYKADISFINSLTQKNTLEADSSKNKSSDNTEMQKNVTKEHKPLFSGEITKDNSKKYMQNLLYSFSFKLLNIAVILLASGASISFVILLIKFILYKDSIASVFTALIVLTILLAAANSILQTI